MHYFKRNIGDYYKKAGRLSILQHGIYTLLIDACHDREVFPTLDEAIEWCWACTEEEITATKFVLKKFFILSENGIYVQIEIEKTIQEYQALCISNKINGGKGGRPKGSLGANKTQSVNNKTQSVNNKTQLEPNRNRKLTLNQEPLTKNQEPRTNIKEKEIVTSVTPDCPHDEIITMYHEILPMLPKIKIWSDKRKGILKTRWRENAKHQSLMFWKNYFTHISRSKFLTGKAGGERPFTPSLEWLIESSHFIDIIERKYHND